MDGRVHLGGIGNPNINFENKIAIVITLFVEFN